MAIEFSEIFEKAVYLFDDPDIRQEYVEDPVRFQMDMRPYLLKGCQEFTHPVVIADMLCDYSSAEGQMEECDYQSSETDNPISYDTEAKTVTYKLGTKPNEEHIDAVAFTTRINNKVVACRYDKAENTVIFSHEALSNGDVVSVSWYYAGAFTDDFSKIGFRGDYKISGIMGKIMNILATSVAVAWSLNEMNRALEVRNILSDADLSFYSPANSAQAKVAWHKAVQREMDSLESQLNWRIYATPKGGSSFGR